MAGRLYFCRHTWERGVCSRCGTDQGATGGGRLPDWATRSRAAVRLDQPREVTVSTATFDPWVTTPLGPSIVAAPAADGQGGVDDDLEDVEVRPRPGRTQLPVSGPPSFVAAVNRVLDELRERAPHRYAEVLTYLTQARHAPELRSMTAPYQLVAGRSDGLFSIDGTDYPSLRFAFLHEVGHNVRGEFVDGRPRRLGSEEEANHYAETVIRELG